MPVGGSFPVADVDGLAAVFGGNMKVLLPPMASIPEEFKNWNRKNKWTQFQSDWFYSGLADLKVTPKPGIDSEKALAHLAAIQSSWEPKHEHKMAGVAFLASLWFEDVSYTKAKP